MDEYPIEAILKVVRTAPDAAAGWTRLRTLCRRHWPSPLWGRFRAVDPARDAAAAATWLRAELTSAGAKQDVRGVYLGLDTLNMEGPHGANVEIGATGAPRPDSFEIDWVYELTWYGTSHLIAGLRVMHEEYARPEWARLFDVADYVLFLGYSGVILAEAAATVRWRRRSLLVWGFHDGDLFILGRGQRAGFERLGVASA
jgi:hypothetical protein